MKVELKNKISGKKKIIENVEHISFITIKNCGFFDMDFIHYSTDIWEINFIHSEK